MLVLFHFTAAVTSLAKFGAHCDSLCSSILVLLSRFVCHELNSYKKTETNSRLSERSHKRRNRLAAVEPLEMFPMILILSKAIAKI